MNQETFGYLKIFYFEIFDLLNFWSFIQWPGLTFSPSIFAFLTTDKMMLYEFLLHMCFAYKSHF